MTIRVVIADDHSVVRHGLRLLLALDPEFELVGEAGNGAEALRLAKELRPDVVLMDLMMPVMDGIAATRAIVQEALGTAVVALTSVTEDGSVEEAVRAGASGYLLKTTDAEDVFRAIRGAASGQVQLSPEVATQLMRRLSTPAPEPPPSLTERETDVLRLLAEGKANKEIARALNIGEKTVKSHVGSLFLKLGVQSRTQAAIHATRAGLVSAGPDHTTPAS